VAPFDVDAPVARLSVSGNRQHDPEHTELLQRGVRDAFYVVLIQHALALPHV
jgi:hypothetical protein